MEDRLLHGGDYNPDQWLSQPSILEDDLAFMKEVKANTFSVGIFAWSQLEPKEGEYNFDWLDKIMDNIVGIGGNVLLATPSGARPPWMAKKYPEVLRTNSRREKLLYGERHNHCFSSPIYRKKTQEINRLLADRYKNHKALFMWHISNEYSGECFCELCCANFVLWLKEKYGTIEAVNAAYWSAFWSHAYSDFDEIEPPSPIGEESVHGLNLDWRRFVTDMTIDFYRNEIVPLRELTPDIPITTNFMGELSQPYPHPYPFAGLDYAKFAKEVDVISWDAYPPWHNDYETTAQTACRLAFLNDYFRMLKNKPFLLLESTPSAVNWQPINKAKRPGMHMLSAVACLAHGADSVMYFQWRKSRGSSEKFHGAVIDHDNSRENRVFKDVAAVGEMLERVKGIKGAGKDANVAIFYDTENYWAISDAQGFNQKDKKYHQCVFEFYSVFWRQNVAVDVVNRYSDLPNYHTVIIPMLYMTNEETDNKLKDYVKYGGHLIGTCLSGMVNENDLVHKNAFSPVFAEIFGINIKETDVLYPSESVGITYGGNSFRARDYCALIELCGATAGGYYTDNFYKDTPAVTLNEYGKGKATFIGFIPERDFLDFYYWEINQEFFKPPIRAENIGVSIQERSILNKDNYKAFCFVMNFTEEVQYIHIDADLTDMITGKVYECGIHKMNPYGVFIFKFGG